MELLPNLEQWAVRIGRDRVTSKMHQSSRSPLRVYPTIDVSYRAGAAWPLQPRF